MQELRSFRLAGTSGFPALAHWVTSASEPHAMTRKSSHPSGGGCRRRMSVGEGARDIARKLGGRGFLEGGQEAHPSVGEGAGERLRQRIGRIGLVWARRVSRETRVEEP